MSPFKQKVIEAVKVIPHGKVVSYGQVAAYIGAPRAARQVGWILRQLGPEVNIPWWRVINQKGRITIDGNLNADRALQKKLLQADGVEVKAFQIEMEKYRWVAGQKSLQKLQLGNEYAEKVSNRFSI